MKSLIGLTVQRAQAVRILRAAPACLALAAALVGTPAGAQGVPSADTVVVVPGAGYGGSGVRRFFLGAHYRDLWTTPIRVRVLDLGTFKGGLTPEERHGGSQTTSLRFQGADGRTYQFRSVYKDPTAILAPTLRTTLVADLLQDGASASHPTAALVVSPLLDAAGVLNAPPTLAVMPDDPALGEFRAEFRGMLGIVEERPDEADREGSGGFGSAVKVIGPDRLFERIDDGPKDLVDERAFLTARLIDILVGDRDRHRDNWRWALMDDSGPARRWLPVSRDHDEAFVKLDGALLGLARRHFPQLVSFSSTYSNSLNLNWHAREVDRRFLAGVDKAVWDSTAAWVQGRLSDSVIADAVHRLPAALYTIHGPELTEALKTRRDGLGEEVDRYYRLLSRVVRIHATNQAELLQITRVDDRFVDVSIGTRDSGAVPYFLRRFDARETREVTIALSGGDDRAVVRGAGDADVTVRVLGGDGRDQMVDSTRARGARFYDVADTEAELGPGSQLDTRPYEEWVGSDLDRYPPREWGTLGRPNALVEVGPNFGVLLGASFTLTNYGFRKSPSASSMTLSGGVATGEGWGRVSFDGVFYRANSDTRFEVEAGLSGIDLLRYHGLGNDTERETSPRDFFVELSQTRFAPSVVRSFASGIEVSVGPFLRFSSTGSDESPFFRSVEDTLYGAGDLGRIGARAAVSWDTRGAADSGAGSFLIRADGEFTPGLWDVRSGFAKLAGDATLYLSGATSRWLPSVALGAGGGAVIGDAPFEEAFYLGGRRNLRGWSTERFAGDAALFGNAEARWRLGEFTLMVPGDAGVFGYADVGRVFVNGASPGGWHTGLGGGLWFSVVDPRNTITLSLAGGRERTVVYFGLGFGF